MQFVWTYWDGGAEEDELRWSIRSIEKHFQGEPPQIVVVGDPPDWFRGFTIHLPKIEEEPNHNFQDVLWKMQNICDHDDIESSFVWMMDDVVAIADFEELDISIPRALKFEYIEGKRHPKKYGRLKQHTFKHLREKGINSDLDFGTHAPHLIQKSILYDLFREWPLRSECLLWEVVYGNVVHGKKQVRSPYPFLCTQADPYSQERLAQALEESTFLNWGNKRGWSPELRAWLQSRFPHASKFEAL